MSMKPTPMDPQIVDAILSFCTQAELARACDLKRQAIAQWFKGLRPVPAKYCGVIETVTEGVVKAEQLRPDLQWKRDKTGLYVRY